MTFARGGNYPCESNPIKSLLGTVTYTGSHLDDMTVSGTYTGDVQKTFRVKVSTAANPDKVDWSEDGGLTWVSTGITVTAKMYAAYGIEINFGAVTGHTATDYWEFICYPIASVLVNQKASLSGIPISADPQVTKRNIYRTAADGDYYYLVAVLNDNISTTLVDNAEDQALGLDLLEDRGVCPLAKYSASWDDRTWVFDVIENIVYYSAINRPEEYDKTLRYITVRAGESNDKGDGIYAYKDYLYIFRRGSIYMIRKRLDGTYGRYEVSKDVGLEAPYSLVEAYGLLMFKSARGWDTFNGTNSYSPLFGLPASVTIKLSATSYWEKVTSVHNRDYNEVWLSLPDIPTTVVFNYVANKFYTFTFPKVPSCLVEARDSTYLKKTIMGTTDGYIYTCDKGDTDSGTAIDAAARTNWMKMTEHHQIVLYELEYEGRTGSTTNVQTYVDMQDTLCRDSYHTGMTPSSSATNRYPIKDKADISVLGDYFSFRFRNNDAYGSSVKINSLKIFFASRQRNAKISPN